MTNYTLTATSFGNSSSAISPKSSDSIVRPPNKTDLAEILIYGIQMYYTPVLVYLGALGNCLSVCVFIGTKLRKSSSSIYLAALAVSDTGFLVSLFVVWLNIVDVGIFNRQGFCQFFVYLTTLCSFLSVWFVVAFTVERFVAVRYPLRRQFMCTVARAKTVSGGLTLLGLVLCSPVFWFSGPQPPPKDAGYNATLCEMAVEWEEWTYVFNVADTVLTFVVPFSAIAVLNALITRTVWRLAGVRRAMTSRECRRRSSQLQQVSRIEQEQQEEGQLRQQRSGVATTSQTKVTKMLLVVSTVFLCFNLPAYVMRVRAFFEERAASDRTTVIIQHVCNLLFHTHFGINFVLYCVSGQNFRRAAAQMICPRPRRRRQQQETTQVTASEYLRSSGSLSRRRTITPNGSWDTHELNVLPSQK